MRERTKLKVSYLKSLLFIIVVIGFVFFFKQNQELVDKIFEIPLPVFCGVAFAFLVTQIISSIHLRLYFSISNVKLSFVESFHYISQQSLGNYFAFSLGFISNMLILKKMKNLSKLDYAAYMIGDQVIKFLSFGVLLAVILLYRLLVDDQTQYLLIYLGVVIFLISPIVIVFLAKSVNLRLAWIRQIQAGLNKVTSRPSVLVTAVLLHVLIILLMSLKFYLIMKYLGQDLEFITLLTFAILTNVIKIASLVPGNLGIRESVGGSVLRTLGHTFENGVSLAIIDRVICTVMIFIFGMLAVASFKSNERRKTHASSI